MSQGIQHVEIVVFWPKTPGEMKEPPIIPLTHVLPPEGLRKGFRKVNKLLSTALRESYRSCRGHSSGHCTHWRILLGCAIKSRRGYGIYMACWTGPQKSERHQSRTLQLDLLSVRKEHILIDYVRSVVRVYNYTL
uniref:Uncharacterized protein n=1 Tax=Neogobius melanostomus TaxID=47308 RepID=A0A8C6TS88_9GOBI